MQCRTNFDCCNGFARPACWFRRRCDWTKSGEIVPTPYLVVEYIDGEPIFSSTDPFEYVAQLATRLAEIHRVDVATDGFAFLRRFVSALERQRERIITSTSLDVGPVRATLESVSPLRALNRPALLHGDFWPGNVVWNRGRIAGVIDWEEGCVGDPLADVAISRLDILWMFGVEAMREFTRCYRSITNLDFSDLPYWDLDAALRPAFNIADWASAWPDLGRPDITQATMRAGHAQFVAQALAALRG